MILYYLLKFEELNIIIENINTLYFNKSCQRSTFGDFILV